MNKFIKPKENGTEYTMLERYSFKRAAMYSIPNKLYQKTIWSTNYLV